MLSTRRPTPEPVTADLKRGTMKHVMLQPCRSRHVRLALALATFGALVGLAGVGGASTAAASTAPSGNSGNTGAGSTAAGVTGLLDMFEFGNSVGLPLACSDAGSLISIIGTQTNSSEALSPLVSELTTQCNELSTKGGGYLQQAIAESQELALINPIVNPLIEALSNGLSTLGTGDGSSLSPFGPTVAGLGGTVSFFEGT
jgi:hypothetical protein